MKPETPRVAQVAQFTKYSVHSYFARDLAIWRPICGKATGVRQMDIESLLRADVCRSKCADSCDGSSNLHWSV